MIKIQKKLATALLMILAPFAAIGAGSPVAGETLSVDLSGVCSKRGNDPLCAPSPAKVTSEGSFRNLMESIKYGNINGVRQSLKEGGAINGRDSNGDTPLTLAISTKNIELVGLLVAAKVNTNIPAGVAGKSSVLPICLSALTGQREISEMLISAGANVNGYSAFDAEGGLNLISPVGCSIIGGSSDILRKFLQSGASPNVEKNLKNAIPPLNIAIAKNNIDAVSALCIARADSNFVIGGKSPLRVAFEQNNLEVARILLENSANPNWVDKNQVSELRFLVKSNNFDGIRLIGKFKPNFQESVDGKTILEEVVSRPELSIKTMRALLSAGASPKGSKLIGKMLSPILLNSFIDQSSRAVNIELMQDLIARGVDTNEKVNGDSLVSYFIKIGPNFYEQNGTFELFEKLVEVSPFLGEPDSQGNLPLVRLPNKLGISPEKFFKIIDIFIAKGVDINARQPSDGLNLLDEIARYHFPMLLKPLDQRGACRSGPKTSKDWKYCRA